MAALSNEPPSLPQQGEQKRQSEDPNTPDASGRPSPLAVVVLTLGSLVIAAGVVLLTGAVVGDRFNRAESNAPKLPSPRIRPRGSRPSGGAEAGEVRPDRMHEVLQGLLSSMTESDALRREGEGEGDSVEPALERVRKMVSADPAGGAESAELPTDVVLPEGSKLLFAVPGTRPRGTLVMARVPGHRAAVQDYFVEWAENHGWATTKRPAGTGSPTVTLLIEKAAAARMITIREGASGEVCVVGIYDFEPAAR